MKKNTLTLTSKQEDQCKALADYAWALSLDPDIPDYHNKVLNLLESALRLNPNSEHILAMLTGMLLQQKEIDKLLTILSPIAEKNPESSHLSLLLSDLYTEKKQPEKTEKILIQCLDAQGHPNPEVVRELSFYYWKIKETSKNIQLLENAVNNTNNEGAFSLYFIASFFYYNMFEQIKENNDLKRHYMRKAVKYINKAKESLCKTAKSTEDIFMLASIFTALGKSRQAVHLLEKARKLGFSSSKIDFYLADLYKMRRCYLSAIQVLKKKVEENPADSMIQLRLADTYILANQFENAINLFLDYLKLVPTDGKTYLQLCRIYLEMDKPEKIIDLSENIQNKKISAMMMNVDAYMKMNNYEQAYKTIKKIEKKAKDENKLKFLTTGFYLPYAHLCDKLGYFEETVKILESALEKDHENSRLCNFLGYIFAEKNEQLQRAEKLIKLALKREPENYAYLDSMAWVYYNQKNYKKALYYIKLTMKLLDKLKRPKDHVILDHAGDIFYHNNQINKAVDYWNKSALTK
ncbi:MAG: tetratricopeptide repeat protein [Verrucomicrobiota bacterium]|nr:tetratricopeptide repeat protein [Verrucomicrobiota bacterium]